MSRISMEAARSETFKAASAANNVGLIDYHVFKQMTDGTVSAADVRNARNLVEMYARSARVDYATREPEAQRLYAALTQQRDLQSPLANGFEDFKDRNRSG